MIEIKELLDLEHSIAAPLFEGKIYPWEVLDDIKAYRKYCEGSYNGCDYKEISLKNLTAYLHWLFHRFFSSLFELCEES